MSVELKPCPFCGTPPFEKLWGERSDETGEVEDGFYEISCPTCRGGLKTPTFCGAHGKSRDDALNAWNQRSPSTERLDNVGGELREVVERAALALQQHLHPEMNAAKVFAASASTIEAMLDYEEIDHSPDFLREMVKVVIATIPAAGGVKSPDRDEVARVINPQAFRGHVTGKTKASARASAFEKADQIIALIPQPAGGEE